MKTASVNNGNSWKGKKKVVFKLVFLFYCLSYKQLLLLLGVLLFIRKFSVMESVHCLFPSVTTPKHSHSSLETCLFCFGFFSPLGDHMQGSCCVGAREASLY